MANQEQCRDEMPRKDQDRPSQASASPCDRNGPSDPDAKRNR